MLACKLTCKTARINVNLQVGNKDKITMGLFEECPISPQRPIDKATSVFIRGHQGNINGEAPGPKGCESMEIESVELPVFRRNSAKTRVQHGLRSPSISIQLE
jgi:hypothetical protein